MNISLSKFALFFFQQNVFHKSTNHDKLICHCPLRFAQYVFHFASLKWTLNKIRIDIYCVRNANALFVNVPNSRVIQAELIQLHTRTKRQHNPSFRSFYARNKFNYNSLLPDAPQKFTNSDRCSGASRLTHVDKKINENSVMELCPPATSPLFTVTEQKQKKEYGNNCDVG